MRLQICSIYDKQPLKLDENGAGRLVLAGLPPSAKPRDLLLEATYADPNGEIQTLSQTQTLWPAAVIAGVRADSWVSVARDLKLQATLLHSNRKYPYCIKNSTKIYKSEYCQQM